MVSLKNLAQDSRKRKTSKSMQKPTKHDFKSSEVVQESDNSDEAPSESESDSDHESIDLKQQENVSLPTRSRPPASGGTSSESESENETTSSGEGEEEEDEEEDEEDKDSKTAADKEATVPEHQKKSAPEAVIRSIPLQRPALYKPPSGFEIEPLNGSLGASEILGNRNLKGKQIWYFTAPAAVDMSTMEQVSLLDLKEGKSSLKHKGEEYQFEFETTKNQTFTSIMIPNSSDGGYQISSKQIDQILHLKLKVNLPGMNGVDPSITSYVKKAPRTQPEGLRMRFHPIGFDPETPEIIGSSSSIDGDSHSDSDIEMASTTYQRPRIPASKKTHTEIDMASPEKELNKVSLLPSKLTGKTKMEKHGKSKTSNPIMESSKKRLYEDGESKKHKKSLFSPVNDLNNRMLKKFKEKADKAIDSRSTSVD